MSRATERPPVPEESSAERAARPLRIIAPTTFLDPLGGIEICLTEDAADLVARGHSIDVMYTYDGTGRTRYRAMGARVSGPFWFGFDTRKAFSVLVAYCSAVRHVRRGDADVIWLNHPEYLVWAQFVGRLSGVPVVTHLHHAPAFNRMRLLSRGMGSFIAVSEYMARLWTARGVPADRVTVVHNAIPIERYPVGALPEQAVARAALDLPAEPHVVTFYGRIDRSKGVLALLQAWRSLDLDPSRAVLVLAGMRNPAETEIDDAISSAPEGSVVVLPPQQDVVPLLHASDVVVAPSIEPESYGRTVVEAMATGRPVVTAAHGGTGELLAGGMERFTVDPTDVASLASTIAGVLDWRTTEPTLGAVCRRWVEEHFPRRAHIAAVEDILTRAARPRRARSGR